MNIASNKEPIYKGSGSMERKDWLQSFERVTSGGTFLPWIDGLRFIAILAVVLYHLNGYIFLKSTGFSPENVRSSELYRWLNGANCGVQLFFAISGFILTLPFAKEVRSNRPVRLRDYYLRRLTRLEPPFLCNLMIVTVLLILVKHELWSNLWPHLLATMTYTHNWVFGEHSRINGVAWSLEIEVQFYMLAPFLLRRYFQWLPRTRRMAALGVIFLLVCSKIVLPVQSLELRLGLVATLEHFLVGILIADLFVNGGLPGGMKSKNWDAVTLITIPALFWAQRFEHGRAIIPFFSCLILPAAIHGPVTNRILSFRGVTIVGGMCYTIYLYHFYILSLLGRSTLSITEGKDFETQFWIQATILVPVILLMSATLFATLERPFMVWKPFQKQGKHDRIPEPSA